MDTDVLIGPMTSPSGDIPETSDKQFLEYSKSRLSEIKARNGMAYDNTCNTLRYTPVGVSSNSPAFGDGSLRPKTTMPTQSTPRPMTPDYRPTEGSHLEPGRPRPNSQEAIHKPNVKPPTYDGTCSWLDYHAQFELVGELNGWNEDVKAMYLASGLRGDARALLGDLDQNARRNYALLVDALNRRFGAENKAELNKTLLKSRRRKKGETLPELAQGIRRLVRNAYPDASYQMMDSLAKDQFMDALDNPDLRWKIFQTRTKSLDEALEIAIECEAFQTAEMQRPNFHNHVRNIETGHGTVKAETTVLPVLQEVLEALRKVVVVLRSPIHANEPSEYNGMLYRTSNRVLNNGIKVIILICMDGTSQYHHYPKAYKVTKGVHHLKGQDRDMIGVIRLAMVAGKLDTFRNIVLR